MNGGFQRFFDFGKELRRPFEVHENCYDCAEFYDGCSAWPADRAFTCATYCRLPDIMPGFDLPPWPQTKHGAPIDAERRCECGEPLPKGKRYCDECRRLKRRETMRKYMRKRRAG